MAALLMVNIICFCSFVLVAVVFVFKFSVYCYMATYFTCYKEEQLKLIASWSLNIKSIGQSIKIKLL